MIYTVTLNPAIDKTADIPGFCAGEVNRVQAVREDAGGKGINVSKCLKALGTQSVAAVVLAGETGKYLEKLLQKEGLETLSVQTQGQTRTNLKLVDKEAGKNTDINEPGPVVDETVLQNLLNTLCEKITPGDIVILSGSLPRGAAPDTYRRWTEHFHTLGAKVILDADGEAMAEGVKAAPDLVKPNETELARLLDTPLDTHEKILAAGQKLLNMGISNVVITMGGDGGFFLWEEEGYRAESLSVPVQSTVGAGDSVVAAMAYGLEKNLPRQEQICLAMAMGAASVMQSGSQAPDVSTVQTLSRQVQIYAFPRG